jgi:hypothetical protein
MSPFFVIMIDDYILQVRIAQTLEELQHLNPDLYGLRYSELYANKGEANLQAWTESMLHQIEQDLINNAQ